MTPASPSLYLERPGPLQRFWGLFRQACIAAFEDNCFGIAKGAAYSSLLAFFPVLASLAAIFASINADAVARVFSRLLFQVIPPVPVYGPESAFRLADPAGHAAFGVGRFGRNDDADGRISGGVPAAVRPSFPEAAQRRHPVGVHRGRAGHRLFGAHRLRRPL
jgi:hypothetical protein